MLRDVIEKLHRQFFAPPRLCTLLASQSVSQSVSYTSQLTTALPSGVNMPGAPLPRNQSGAAASTSASTSRVQALKTQQKYSFNTLERENRFKYPSTTSHDVPSLEELVAPHIQSFDALFADPATGKGLLELAVSDITSKVIYDGKGKEQGRLGNRLESKLYNWMSWMALH